MMMWKCLQASVCLAKLLLPLTLIKFVNERKEEKLQLLVFHQEGSLLVLRMAEAIYVPVKHHRFMIND